MVPKFLTLSIGFAVGQVVGTESSTLVAILVALFSGGMAAAAVSWLTFRRIGPYQIKEMESHAADLAVSAMKNALSQREADLAAALQRIESLERQVRELTIQIAKLENALETSLKDREDIRKKLDDAMRERALLIGQLEELNRQLRRDEKGDEPVGGWTPDDGV